MKRRLIEHYEVVRKLGAGGSGVVYLANDTLLMRPVVLKILKRGALTIEQMRRTVLREARLASAIEHPNVCAIYEVGDSEDEAYIVMQYVPGDSLDKIIANGPASVQLGLSVGIQIPGRMPVVPGETLAFSQQRDLQCFAVFHVRDRFNVQIFGRHLVVAMDRDRSVAHPGVPATADAYEVIQNELHRGEFARRRCCGARGIRARQERQCRHCASYPESRASRCFKKH